MGLQVYLFVNLLLLLVVIRVQCELISFGTTEEPEEGREVDAEKSESDRGLHYFDNDDWRKGGYIPLNEDEDEDKYYAGTKKAVYHVQEEPEEFHEPYHHQEAAWYDNSGRRRKSGVLRTATEFIFKHMATLLIAYKLKFFTLIPVLIAGLLLIVGSTGMAGFFFALFAAAMGLRAGASSDSD